MKEAIRFVRNEFEENEVLVRTYIFPSLCGTGTEELAWSNLAYLVKYKNALERDNTRELAAFSGEDVIGFCVLKYIDYENQNIMVSTRLLADEEGNIPSKDMAARFLDTFADFIFDRFDVGKIYGLVDADCPYMEAIRSCGFSEEGCLKENFYKNGAYIDQYVFAKKRERIEK